jgi:hypothetical protein
MDARPPSPRPTTTAEWKAHELKIALAAVIADLTDYAAHLQADLQAHRAEVDDRACGVGWLWEHLVPASRN